MKRVTFLLFLVVACFAFANETIAAPKKNAVYLTCQVSSSPIHLSLCVVDINGKIQYITAEQWKNMSEGNKLNYTKKGVVIAENGEAFLVAMRDSGTGDWYWACGACNLPSKWQLELIYGYKESLNNALRIYGGQPLDDVWYWSSTEHNSSGAWYVFMYSGVVGTDGKAYAGRARAVAPVPVASAM